MNKLYYKDIENYLLKHSIKIISKLDKNSIFTKLSTLANANNNDLTFFHNDKYLNDLKNTKAKACFIENKNVKYINNNCVPIIVENPYLVYALTTNLIYPLIQSNGIIEPPTVIQNEIKIELKKILKNYISLNKIYFWESETKTK